MKETRECEDKRPRCVYGYILSMVRAAVHIAGRTKTAALSRRRKRAFSWTVLQV